MRLAVLKRFTGRWTFLTKIINESINITEVSLFDLSTVKAINYNFSKENLIMVLMTGVLPLTIQKIFITKNGSVVNCSEVYKANSFSVY